MGSAGHNIISDDSEMNNGCNEVDQPMSRAALAESLSNIVDASCSDEITRQIEADRTESSIHQEKSLETVDIISDEEKQADYSEHISNYTLELTKNDSMELVNNLRSHNQYISSNLKYQSIQTKLNQKFLSIVAEYYLSFWNQVVLLDMTFKVVSQALTSL
ncbi:unnamed protein product [Allacma fusca]|uniref:Uncharacterized protein n=1 Tax=Allacma fusca TaxID=39272 RepID=A0A8J2NYY6_9HEXA|nr:unnamed protein product [Allacma fusca]